MADDIPKGGCFSDWSLLILCELVLLFVLSLLRVELLALVGMYVDFLFLFYVQNGVADFNYFLL